MAAKIIENFIKMALFKKGGAIATDKAVQFSANALEKRLINLGIDPRTLNNQTELKQVLAYVKQMEDAAFDQKFSGIMKNQNLFKKEGDVIPFKQKRSFAEEMIEECASFPYGDHDDLVDSMTMAVMRFRQGGFLPHPEDYEDEKKEPRKMEYY